MTAEEFTQARNDIARVWGIRRLTKADLGRALGSAGRDPGQMVALYENGGANVPPHIVVLMKLYLRGTMPPQSVKDTIKAFQSGER